MLGAFRYTENEAVLHTDSGRAAARTRRARLLELPRGDDGTSDGHVLPEPAPGGSRARRDYCVTLNEEIAAEHVIAPDRLRRIRSTRSTRSRRSRSCRRCSGRRHTHYAGAYHGNGFHEDGLASGRPRGRRAGGAPGEIRALHRDADARPPRRRRATSSATRSRTGCSTSTSCPSSTGGCRSLSVNRPERALASATRDHFDGDATPLKQAVIDFAGDPTIERVLVLTQLRVLGYVFNPVSFYWCYRADGSLACMIAELNNTFGERLPELLARRRRSTTSTTSGSTSRRSSGSTSATSTRSRSRATRCSRASTCARTATDAAARRCSPDAAPSSRTDLGRRLPRPLPADAACR